MKSILVPVDHSKASENAVDFAVQWSLRFGYDQVILFRVYYESLFSYIATVGSTGYAFTDKEAWQNHQKDAKRLVKQLRKTAEKKAGDSVAIRTALSDLPLMRGIREILESDGPPEMIILGSDNGSEADEGFISSNIIEIVRYSPVRVMVVPEQYSYKEVKNILVPCDLSHISNLSKLDRYKLMLEANFARLMILNIRTKAEKDEDARKLEWETKLQEYFQSIPHDIFYASDPNIINGILSFVQVHDTEVIVALPGEHSFLYHLANKSISEGIYRNAEQIVLVLK